MGDINWSWVVVNIIAPIILPILGLLLMAWFMPLSDEQKQRARIITTVQDGQLGWLAVAWSMAAVYEAIDHMQKLHTFLPWVGGLLLGEFFVVLGGMFIAAGGAVTATEAPRADQRYLVWSIIVTIVSAVVFTAVHLALE
jgi:hypothetical protein